MSLVIASFLAKRYLMAEVSLASHIVQKAKSQSGAIRSELSQFSFECIKERTLLEQRQSESLFQANESLSSTSGGSSMEGSTVLASQRLSSFSYLQHILFMICGGGGGGSTVHIASRIRMSPSGSDKLDQFRNEVDHSSRARNESASSNKRKSLSPKGVRVGEAVETIGSKYGVGLPLATTLENPRTS
ncbi:hypothetical protein Tco_1055707 [Tanacetum coccineum]|uniref:Uncharacterized protein n=1 Tax=Tanacetum coccineum TaxID=301880 RepID=A0ABQ5H0G0_9ASTR